MSQNISKKLAREKKKREQNRKQLILLIGGGLLLIAGALFAVFRNPKPEATIEVIGSPSLKVDQEVVDLGDVTLGNPVQVSFQLTNIGDQILRFTEDPTLEVLEGC
jgi:hypothetical protein